MHLHAKGTSHCARENPETIISDYLGSNYTGIVCTNHWNSTSISQLDGFLFKTKLQNFINVFLDFKKKAEDAGIKVYFGIELALHKQDYKGLRQNCSEILVYGITLEEFIEYNKSLIHTTYEKLRSLADKHGWVLVQSHPHRPFTKILPIDIVHGWEVYNSHAGHKENNHLSLALCQKYNGIGTCGSDYHNKGMQKTGLIVNGLPENEKALAALLKSRNYILSHPEENL